MVLDNQLINSPMEFRSKLTLPYKVNFGLEMELDKVNIDEENQGTRIDLVLSLALPQNGIGKPQAPLWRKRIKQPFAAYTSDETHQKISCHHIDEALVHDVVRFHIRH